MHGLKLTKILHGGIFEFERKMTTLQYWCGVSFENLVTIR